MDPSQRKPRKLGVIATGALVVGNMVGSGVFLLPSSLAEFGGVSLLGWLITTAGALCLALVFARLAASLPADGGPYAYVRHAFGDFAGFLVAWGYWISIWCGNAGIAAAVAGYSGALSPWLSESPLRLASVAVGAIWFLTWVNSRGVRKAADLQVATTLLKLIPLGAIGVVGLFSFDASHFEPFNPSGQSLPAALGATAVLTLWAFLGLESASIPASEVERPERTIPRATIAGTILAAVIYICSTTAVLGVVEPAVLAAHEAPFAAAGRVLWGDPGAMMIAVGAVVAAFGALNGWILLQARMPAAAARDGLFPAVFARRNRHGIPIFSLLVSSALTTLLTAMNFTRGLVDQFTFFILLATLATLLPYVLSSLALITLRLREPQRFPASGRRRVLALGLLGFLYSVGAVVGAGAEILYWGLLLFASGIPVFMWMSRRR